MDNIAERFHKILPPPRALEYTVNGGGGLKDSEYIDDATEHRGLPERRSPSGT